MVEPLSAGQKMFNQRLLAAHCLPDKDARALYESLAAHDAHMGETFEDCVGLCNAQLEYAGLQIMAVSMQEEESSSSSSQDSSNSKLVRKRYYAMVNTTNDDLTKKAFSQKWTPAQHGLVRLVLEKLATDGPTARSQLLHLRNSLDQQDAKKLTLAHAETVLDGLLEERWLRTNKKRASHPAAMWDLAPRAYLELSYFLQAHGMQDLPQTLVHRV